MKEPTERPAPAELTRFLNALGRGELAAGNTLMPHVYEELRAIAEAHMRRQPRAGTLQPTVLVHEAFLKLFQSEGGAWQDRKHFFALAAKAMRQIVVDDARRRRSLKRDGGHELVTLGESLAGERGFDLLDVHLALEELCLLDERQARVVELRYFGGLEMEEVALVMDTSKSTVEREWRAARAWLGLRLQDGEPR